ncbi:hypothetical protein DTO96_101972 [Ephemeroptericola cinctiostellae]|uniref:HTH tetR-type domain-containing protein n=1 Tax=Ephemeroptericola cinctiostellae TaxID=2268024 RepID=A0A345DCY8_9BURK|nr:TetR/AcrR family transcriptional regulator [Ephemeroptericola cinctiostellae]AXF86226.1 hypothetical protein DTO96_101972 [Ephemeroptericola cinctiostellae]
MKKAEKIIQTAEKLFYKHGFNGIGVDVIRDESGCSKTTMYKAFTNKENLIKEVLKYRDNQFRESLINYVGEDKGVEAVTKILKWHHNWFNQPQFNGCLFVRSLAELRAPHKDASAIAIEHKEWVRHFIYEKVQGASKAHDLADQLFIIIEGQINIHLIYKDNSLLRDNLMGQGVRMIEILMQEW